MTLTKSFIEKFNLLVGVLVLMATIFGLWYQTNDKTPGLTLDVLSIDELTELSATPNLKASFKYNGADVSHLWKLVFRIKNTGDVVLIGKGGHSNLLEKNIPITFGDNFKIIDFETNYNDLNVSINNNKNKTIDLEFDQWRSDELAVVAVYLESKGKKNSSPIPKTETRSIVNGTIEINDLSSVKGTTKKNPFYVFPERMIEWAKLIFGIFTIICIGIAAMIAFLIPTDYIKRKRWEKRNYEAFSNYLDGLGSAIPNEEIDSYLVKKYKANPESVPEFIWSEFQGDRLSTDSITTTLKGTVAFTLISTLILLSVVVIVLGT